MERLLPHIAFLIAIAGFTIGLCAEDQQIFTYTGGDHPEINVAKSNAVESFVVQLPELRVEEILPVTVHLEDGTAITIKYATATPTERALIRAIMLQYHSHEEWIRHSQQTQEMLLEMIQQAKDKR